MERRGFLESFAKSTVGTMLALEEMLKEDDIFHSYKYHPPRIVKVTDETLLTAEGELRLSTLRMVLKAGLEHLYPEDKVIDFFKTLFPGINQESKIGIRIHPQSRESKFTRELTTNLIDSLLKYASEDLKISQDNFLIWDYDTQVEGSSVDRISPYPELEHICQFLIAQTTVSAIKSECAPCRDVYLSCFANPTTPDWLTNSDDKELNSIYENFIYPWGMKFRLFIVEKFLSENTIYFASEGIILDNYFSITRIQDIDLNVIEIINPSAPIIPNIRVNLKGDGTFLEWSGSDYDGKYQIFRSLEGNFNPGKKYLIATTHRTKYFDKTGEYLKKYHYIITREWL